MNVNWVLIFITLTSLYGCGTTSQDKNTELYGDKTDSSEVKMVILADTASTLLSDQSLPAEIKSELSRQVITPLRKSNKIDILGKDEDTRPLAVNFQKAFEQSLLDMLDEKRLRQVIAIIHTPMPATPLCNPHGKHLVETLHPEVQRDPDRIKTVEDRTITVRRMARYGSSLSLYITYPKGGLEKRSIAQQKIYLGELNDKNNTSLNDNPLSHSSMPDNIIGASYLLTTPDNQTLFFSLVGKQAIAGTGTTNWQFWFGNLTHTEVSTRHDEVAAYLKQGGQNIPF